MKQQIGFTLIELMIGLVINMLILLCVISIYLATEKNQSIQVALNTIEDNASVASMILHEVIQKAGFSGCAQLNSEFPITNTTQNHFSEKDKIAVIDNRLIIKNASTDAAILEKDMRSHSLIYVKTDMKLLEGDVLFISNCKTADIFLIKTISIEFDGVEKIVANKPLGSLYGKNAEVRRLEVNTYYIDKTNRLSQLNVPVYALYVKDINGHKSELVEGINNIFFEIESSHSGQFYPERLLTRGTKITDVDTSDDKEKFGFPAHVGVSISLQLTSLNSYFLQKKWFIYTALRN